MRKILLLLLLSPITLIAQQAGVAINTDGSAPDAKAILDVKSTDKGILIPRMTTAQRTAINPATKGLLVFDNTTSSFWFYNGTAWAELAGGGGGSHWLASGNNIYNANSGNVGIGTNLPASKFHLAGNMLMNSTNPIIQFQQDGTDKGFVQLSGNNLRLGTNSDNGTGKIVLRASGNDHVFIDSIGQVGIGKSSPGFDLDVNGNARIQTTGGFKRSTLSMYANPYYRNSPFGPAGLTFFNWNDMGGDNYDYTAKFRMEFEGGLSEKIKLYHVDHDNQLVLTKAGNIGIGVVPSAEKVQISGNLQLQDVNPLLKIKSTSQFLPTTGIEINTNGGNAAKILYTENALKITEGAGANDLVLKGGKVGIGTETPEEQLHLIGNMQLNYFDPMIRFQNSGVEKGFVDLSSNDLRIGTFSSNATGNFKVRVNGGDRMIVDPNGTLQLAGGVDVGLASNGYLMIGNPAASNIVFDNNEIMARNNGAVSSLVLQNDGGSVRIGNTAVPAGYKFAISGKMVCEELKVKLASSGWPDYVFDNKYKLPTLNELENYIHQNKHLPNIPSAAEVEKNGLEVGDMQKKMMEKIEELTLYVIELQKQIDDLKNKRK